MFFFLFKTWFWRFKKGNIYHICSIIILSVNSARSLKNVQRSNNT